MSLHTTMIGTGSAHLVFVHGLFGQGKNFTSIARNLSDAATSILVDLPNHGRSLRTDSIDYGEYARYLEETVTAIGDEPVTLIGHSMGGKVAMRAALEYPYMVERMVILDIAPAYSGDPSYFQHIADSAADLDLSRISTRADADEALADQITDTMVRRFILQSLQRDKQSSTGWSWLLNLPVLQNHLDAMAAWQPPRIASSTWSGPLLWLVGEYSVLQPTEHWQTMKTYFPHTSLEIIPDAGHWVHSDAPADVTRAIREMIS